MTYAPPATRPYDSARIVLGMIGIPVSVYTDTIDKGALFERHLYTRADGHPVGVQKYDKETGEVVAQADTCSKVETSLGPVFVSDTEIESLLTLSPKTITIKAFYPLSSYGSTFVPKQFRSVEPAKVTQGKKKLDDPMATAQFAVLLAAMKAENVLAFCEYVTRGKPIPTVLLPDGRLIVVRFEEELRERRPLNLPEPKAEHVEGLRGLIQAMGGGDTVDLSDRRSHLILNFAEEKAAAGDFGEAPEAEVTTVAASAPVDFMALLQASMPGAA